MNLQKIEEETRAAVTEAVEKAQLEAGDLFVIGCSTSEVCGGTIGKNSSRETGEVIVRAARAVLKERKIFLAVQACEHLNRALVLEKEAAKKYAAEEASVIPALHAGSACAEAAYLQAEHPVMAEHITAQAGIDIGDTEIGMHVKFVQVPLRLENNTIGSARVTALKSRPKLIGGERARYSL